MTGEGGSDGGVAGPEVGLGVTAWVGVGVVVCGEGTLVAVAVGVGGE